MEEMRKKKELEEELAIVRRDAQEGQAETRLLREELENARRESQETLTETRLLREELSHAKTSIRELQIQVERQETEKQEEKVSEIEKPEAKPQLQVEKEEAQSEEEMFDVQEYLSMIEQNRADLIEMLKESDKKRKETEEENHTLVANLEVNRSQMTAVHQLLDIKQKEITSLVDSCDTLQSKLHEALSENLSLKQEFIKQSEKIIEIRSKEQTINEEIEDLRENLARSISTIEILQEQLRTLRETSVTRVSILPSPSIDMSDKVGSLQREKDLLQKQLEEERLENEKLRSNVELSEELELRLRRIVEDEKKKITSLQILLAEEKRMTESLKDRFEAQKRNSLQEVEIRKQRENNLLIEIESLTETHLKSQKQIESQFIVLVNIANKLSSANTQLIHIHRNLAARLGVEQKEYPSFDLLINGDEVSLEELDERVKLVSQSISSLISALNKELSVVLNEDQTQMSTLLMEKELLNVELENERKATKQVLNQLQIERTKSESYRKAELEVRAQLAAIKVQELQELSKQAKLIDQMEEKLRAEISKQWEETVSNMKHSIQALQSQNHDLVKAHKLVIEELRKAKLKQMQDQEQHKNAMKRVASEHLEELTREREKAEDVRKKIEWTYLYFRDLFAEDDEVTTSPETLVSPFENQDSLAMLEAYCTLFNETILKIEWQRVAEKEKIAHLKLDIKDAKETIEKLTQAISEKDALTAENNLVLLDLREKMKLLERELQLQREDNQRAKLANIVSTKKIDSFSPSPSVSPRSRSLTPRKDSDTHNVFSSPSTFTFEDKSEDLSSHSSCIEE
eukprot:TRINITY_DN3051_c0_g1_i1.p1 TRINITY_DN3051_c0_g1~~TRINITY_DN3051_c0_g1_i1.p1  ORF type:complete len:805 (+),score=301.19 TRINITY_DN3051_c0_g1_i1:439-2853(+)